MPKAHPGEFEQLVLLAIVRLADEAYGTTIRREIESRTRRSVSVGALYTTLDRLERKGFIRGELGDPTPQRGGRAKRDDRLGRAGALELRRARLAQARMWDGLEPEEV
jgi:PadR family transcriptional regulator